MAVVRLITSSNLVGCSTGDALAGRPAVTRPDFDHALGVGHADQLGRAAFALTLDCAKKLLNTGTSLSSSWLLATVSTKPIAAINWVSGTSFSMTLVNPSMILTSLANRISVSDCYVAPLCRWAPRLFTGPNRMVCTADPNLPPRGAQAIADGFQLFLMLPVSARCSDRRSRPVLQNFPWAVSGSRQNIRPLAMARLDRLLLPRWTTSR